jgi:molybdate transport system substrate-binding protein
VSQYRLAVALVSILASASPSADGRQPTADSRVLVVSAAASLADVMRELTTKYRDEAGVELRVNTGGSNTLARQIVEGARVDVFLSADAAQMDVVEKAGRLLPGSRSDFVANALVVIVSSDTPAPVSRVDDLAGAGVRRIAMGNPASVPAGVYGRRWLETSGLWPRVSPKVVPLPTVRAALAAVQEGRADAGIVYATDARTTSAVRVALVAPDGEAPAVVYPAAVIRGSREEPAARLLAWLRGATAMRVFTAAGFRTVEP